ncbi:MAG: hypothetical protein ACI81P_000115 [Neolewinella sp.]|jgi:hypothetical protein
MTDDYGTIDSGLATNGVQLSSTDLSNLRTAGKWGRFIAIVTLVSIGLMVLGMLSFGGVILAALGPELEGMGAAGGTFILVIYAAIFALYIYPIVMLYKFSTNAIKAADGGNSVAASDAFTSLKSMFKFMGILLAIVLSLYALMFVLAMIGGAASMIM